MPAFGPIKRRDLILYLRKVGFTGPYSGGKHQFMQKAGLSLTIPNPHGGDIGPKLLGMLLRQAGVDRSEWEKF
jgi:predicted RNA binding protein YcfA (HicA-like mRNA interferase family)